MRARASGGAVHPGEGGDPRRFQSFAKGKGASDVSIPAEVVVREDIPLLGAGKIDLVALDKLARERADAPEAA